ncbi:MAG: hypothetical protein KME46_29635 [Brasilonema angustatum HA4187-MV1]|jgi:hypothetical protein|nr:hypothetical protein [Brasilonema angustatum HA4187-MV1]
MIHEGAEVVKVTNIIVSFIEYKLVNGDDTYETKVTSTIRTRIDEVMGILTLGIGVMQSCPDAYLDPQATENWTNAD